MDKVQIHLGWQRWAQWLSVHVSLIKGPEWDVVWSWPGIHSCQCLPHMVICGLWSTVYKAFAQSVYWENHGDTSYPLLSWSMALWVANARYGGWKILALAEKSKLVMVVPLHTWKKRTVTSHGAALCLATWMQEKGVCEELKWNPTVATANETKGQSREPGKYHGRPIGSPGQSKWFHPGAGP